MKYPIGRSDIINEVDNRYGKLVVLKQEILPQKHNAYWMCLCDCGKTTIVAGSSLRSGTTKSCGCLTNKLPKGEGSFRHLVLRYKQGAKKRGLKFQLSDEQLKWLFRQPCHYCNSDPTTIVCGSRSNGGFTYNGIDRIDNTKGYTKDNCVSCCKICNRAKNNMNQTNFLIWLQKVAVFNLKVKQTI